MSITLPQALVMFGAAPAVVMALAKLVALQFIVVYLMLGFAGGACWLGWQSENRK